MRALEEFKFFGKPMVCLKSLFVISSTSINMRLQRIQYAKEKSTVLKKLKGEYEVASGTELVAAEKPTRIQEQVFGSGPAPTKAKPLNAPSAAAPAAVEPPLDDSAKGTKRTREEEDGGEDDDEEADMDVSDSE
jgi:hypothetical protein